ncbi:MAG: Shedu anti-phage system protein SduA domain-containing protein [Weeksellaceae bacterium]
MSVPYHNELFNNGKVRLYLNFSNLKDDVADESLTLHFYAIDNNGIPIFTETLQIEEIRLLYQHLDAISIIKENLPNSSKFIEISDELDFLISKLKESDLETILTLLQKFESDDKIKGLLSSLSDIEIENLHGAYHHKMVSEELLNLQKLLDLEEEGRITQTINDYGELLKYSAGQPEKIFQNWIESNLWVFGIEYIRKHDARQIALFSEGDLLMQSVDGYLDLIELKRPKHSILKYDRSHDCYYPHPDLSIVIGQSLFYLQKLIEYKHNLESEYGLKIIMPRIKIIVGRNSNCNDKERDCLRMLNSNLQSIQIITYDDLLTFGNILLKSHER